MREELRPIASTLRWTGIGNPFGNSSFVVTCANCCTDFAIPIRFKGRNIFICGECNRVWDNISKTWWTLNDYFLTTVPEGLMRIGERIKKQPLTEAKG